MMKRYLLIVFVSLIGMYAAAQSAPDQRIQWLKNDRLGLFLHWGLYSEAAGDWKGRKAQGADHFMMRERIPLKEYAKIAKTFNPVDYSAMEWVRAAKHTGLKYIVITTKHHDGFSMFDSKCSDYDIVDCTPFAKDPMADLAEACHKEGIKLGFYYSLGRDWEDPDVPTNWPTKGGRSNTWDYPDEDAKDLSAYIERKVKPQLRELLTNYGKVDIIWFDTPEMVTEQQSKEIRELILSLQPECLINDRIGNNMGDYATVEQKLTDEIDRGLWEGCLKMGANWGYNRYDTVYAGPDMIVRYMTDMVSKGGNMLLNIGPDNKGRFPKLTEPIMNGLHHWLKANGEAIYGTEPWRIYGENFDPNNVEEKVDAEFHDAIYNGLPQNAAPDFRYTVKGKKVYIIVRHVPATSFTLRAFKAEDRIRSIKCLSEKTKVTWDLTDDGLAVHLSNPVNSFPVYVLQVTMKE
ncbi:alpha-L-fucosidase [Bacteroides sp. 51]|uniref:alpha-L-fucosidase n=1 Tax=Bacteroides sp. 51 TaxID=2302938 RepID=UPI001EF19750|nr:alpha-L-fucosidase [Bacteroides sp. 51]